MKIRPWVIITVALLWLFAAVPVSAEVPILTPQEFYGAVTINGSPAPANTVIQARGTNVMTGIKGNPILTDQSGNYQKLVVQGQGLTDATEVSFYVNGVKTGQPSNGKRR